MKFIQQTWEASCWKKCFKRWLEIKRVSMTRTISTKYQSYSWYWRIGAVWFEEIVVAVSFDNINAFQNMVCSRSSPRSREVCKIFSEHQDWMSSWIVDIINSCLIIKEHDWDLCVCSIYWKTIARVWAGKRLNRIRCARPPLVPAPVPPWSGKQGAGVWYLLTRRGPIAAFKTSS